mmetsp:Transcript_44275/g.93030  ORF Transcript_44275/g.93030 Transcript_44275/m.93030 type:complete len:87 (+) Transcript_44275:102-362(+)
MRCLTQQEQTMANENSVPEGFRCSLHRANEGVVQEAGERERERDRERSFVLSHKTKTRKIHCFVQKQGSQAMADTHAHTTKAKRKY